GRCTLNDPPKVPLLKLAYAAHLFASACSSSSAMSRTDQSRSVIPAAIAGVTRSVLSQTPVRFWRSPSCRFAEAIGRQRRDRDDRDGIPQGFLQEAPEHGDQAVREVVEAPEAGEA